MSRLTERVTGVVGSLGTGAKHEIEALFTASDRARFWAKVEKRGPNECWLWTASRFSRGYGQFGVMTPGGKSRKQLHLYAHRVAWSLTRGPIPLGMSVLHHCDVPACCNTAHLFIGDQTDNMRDAAAKGRLSVPRPRRQKVTAEQLAEIDALLESGVLQSEIASRYNVSKGWVCSYVSGRLRRYDRPAQTPRLRRSA